MFHNYFNFDILSKSMIFLVCFLGFTIFVFAKNYMKGSKYYHFYLSDMILMIATLILMFASDNIWLLFLFWLSANYLLVGLILGGNLAAARYSAKLASENFMAAAIMMVAAFALLQNIYNTTSIDEIITLYDYKSKLSLLAMALLAICAFMQCGLWPFHKWLLNSLNAPTPTSALMHAGLVNGGGFLLVRFSPLYLENNYLLDAIVIVGFLCAIIGSVWKLVQSDVKRMLACSTLSQMGFMIMQCGLGLFASAIAHLIWHGMFKAYLFLSSASSVFERKNQTKNNIIFMIPALICGALGVYVFMKIFDKEIALNSYLVLFVMIFIAATQISLRIFNDSRNPVLAVLGALIVVTLYGISVKIIANFDGIYSLNHERDLNLLHIFIILTMTTIWLAVNFGKHLGRFEFVKKYFPMIYMKILNAAKPDKNSVTL